jgi:signal transduction histidine kinase
MIARELHDSVAQELSAIKMGYDSLIDSHSEIPEDIRERTLALSKTLQKTISAVRDLSYDLRPPELEKAGIIQSLFNFCSEFSEKHDIHVDFYSVGMENIELDDFTKINIYRLVQEGLNNVNKHAQASHVDVMFSYTHPDIVLRITDNGRGFDVEKRLAAITAEKRMGLRSMQERVTLLGGMMSVQSIPLHGTKITIKLPYGKDFHD